MMGRRVAGVVTLFMLAGLPALTPGAQAQTPPPPVVADSLTAIGELVSKTGAHCQLKDAADDETTTNNELPFVLCDDGVPAGSGGPLGIPVPVAYHSSAAGNDFSGLPRPADAEEIAEKNATFDL